MLETPPPWPRGRRRSPAMMSGFLHNCATPIKAMIIFSMSNLPKSDTLKTKNNGIIDRRSVPLYQLGTTHQMAYTYGRYHALDTPSISSGNGARNVSTTTSFTSLHFLCRKISRVGYPLDVCGNKRNHGIGRACLVTFINKSASHDTRQKGEEAGDRGSKPRDSNGSPSRRGSSGRGVSGTSTCVR